MPRLIDAPTEEKIELAELVELLETGDFDPSFERGRPFKTKGSRRNIRRRKRGFD